MIHNQIYQVAERMKTTCIAELKQSRIHKSLIREECVKEESFMSFGDGTGIV
jgi:hypothetical protein